MLHRIRDHLTRDVEDLSIQDELMNTIHILSHHHWKICSRSFSEFTVAVFNYNTTHVDAEFMGERLARSRALVTRREICYLFHSVGFCFRTLFDSRVLLP